MELQLELSLFVRRTNLQMHTNCGGRRTFPLLIFLILYIFYSFFTFLLHSHFLFFSARNCIFNILGKDRWLSWVMNALANNYFYMTAGCDRRLSLCRSSAEFSSTNCFFFLLLCFFLPGCQR